MDASNYVVVARRYRPQRFSELVGQEHVARALAGAITSGRVGHAYLFTGARGVGKTSAARILAKALNCERGPTPEPCNECDLCQSVSRGDDVDVLEIDGASNRGIDEIRQLRQNVNVRPSRARYKIYIIDEVHMLTREAFNALLKTLEEPPEHVKFIFCTTEPEKVPITVISRCQRFDFAGIQSRSIAERLRQIVETEGLEAEDEALEILARRAGGSMRDSQSLLEQLLAFGGQKITAADVHRMLGTAAQGRLTTLLEHIARRDGAAAIGTLDAALAEGVDVGQLLDQLLGYLRDAMILSVGGPAELLLNTSPSEEPVVKALAGQLGVETVLAMMQIVDQALARMRVSTYRRTLAELAVVRMCSLENLQDISLAIRQMAGGTAKLQAVGVSSAPGQSVRPPPPSAPSSPVPVRSRSDEGAPAPAPAAPAKKNLAVEVSELGTTNVSTGEVCGGTSITPENVREIWGQAVAQIGDMAAAAAEQFREIAILAPNHLVVRFPARYKMSKALCERPERAGRIEATLAQLVGSRVRVEFAVDDEASGPQAPPAAVANRVSPRERLRQVASNPLVQRACEVFRGTPLRVDDE